MFRPLLWAAAIRLSIQACIEGENSSSPKVITRGCVEHDAGVDTASGLGRG